VVTNFSGQPIGPTIKGLLSKKSAFFWAAAEIPEQQRRTGKTLVLLMLMN
jgi:hypothetical protein